MFAYILYASSTRTVRINFVLLMRTLSSSTSPSFLAAFNESHSRCVSRCQSSHFETTNLHRALRMSLHHHELALQRFWRSLSQSLPPTHPLPFRSSSSSDDEDGQLEEEEGDIGPGLQEGDDDDEYLSSGSEQDSLQSKFFAPAVRAKPSAREDVYRSVILLLHSRVMVRSLHQMHCTNFTAL
jgi:hypothetical protein